LLAPISIDAPGGNDQSFSPLFDEIREARRADDPLLAQGDWAITLKTAEWPKTRILCERALSTVSKDLQIAAWYTEAQTRLHGFAGAAFGFQVLHGLLERYWEQAFPAFDPLDLDERVSKFEWLDKQLPQVFKEIPLTAVEHGGYHWLAWEESRAVENLGLKDPEAREQALREGKISGEAFERAATASGPGFYRQLVPEIDSALAALDQLEAVVEHEFGQEAPILREIRQSLMACAALAARHLQRLGGSAATHDPVAVEAAPAIADCSVRKEPTIDVQPGIPAIHVPHQPGAPIRDRRDAVQRLREVADYFRMHEPHSPVAYLAERTAKWAEMSLEEWLGSVIKDDSTLGQLRELLDIKTAS
jgi:type VI secretion system protein ImpA